ncbi:hypothetical protein B0H66DRAFT_564819 [Apodospora peruviana]|uniref:Uncharacterized protein n=1 Tax=Apodospora peruviana TaxID=516989 RepID=A0AAE0HYJ6_9PEZI|nr:hypothetical protein B0H66DRAFT_564819 [Apodospora peruviana]
MHGRSRDFQQLPATTSSTLVQTLNEGHRAAQVEHNPPIHPLTEMVAGMMNISLTAHPGLFLDSSRLSESPIVWIRTRRSLVVFLSLGLGRGRKGPMPWDPAPGPRRLMNLLRRGGTIRPHGVRFQSPAVGTKELLKRLPIQQVPQATLKFQGQFRTELFPWLLLVLTATSTVGNRRSCRFLGQNILMNIQGEHSRSAPVRFATASSRRPLWVQGG